MPRLVLSRRQDESILLSIPPSPDAREVRVKVAGFQLIHGWAPRVRLSTEAPADIRIDRINPGEAEPHNVSTGRSLVRDGTPPPSASEDDTPGGPPSASRPLAQGPVLFTDRDGVIFRGERPASTAELMHVANLAVTIMAAAFAAPAMVPLLAAEGRSPD